MRDTSGFWLHSWGKHCFQSLLFGDHRGRFGLGDTGRFYRAQDTPLDCHVAVKVLSAPDVGTEARTRLDWAEAHATRGEPGDRGAATPCPGDSGAGAFARVPTVGAIAA